MKSYADIFKISESFLRGKGVVPIISKGKQASITSIKKFQAKTEVLLPPEFSLFYTQFANGFEFTWEQDEETGGGLIIPPLDQLAKNHQHWLRNVHDFLDDPHSLDGCVAPKFRANAFEIWQQMLSWLPIGCNSSEGDEFCLDTKTGRIVHNQHDWFDGFGKLAKMNGIIAGENFQDFLLNWSRFSFCPPTSLWWGEFGKFSVVKWEADYFNKEFHRIG